LGPNFANFGVQISGSPNFGVNFIHSTFVLKEVEKISAGC
jgi:hypothetical protein